LAKRRLESQRLERVLYRATPEFSLCEDGNLNRTILFSKADVGRPKALAAAGRARQLGLAAQLLPHTRRLQELAVRGPWLERLVCTVDSRRARRLLQEELPRDVAFSSGNHRFAAIAVAEDMAADAVAYVLGAPDVAWDASKVDDAMQAIRSRINTLISNRRKSKAEEARALDGKALAVAGALDPEQALIEKEEHEWQAKLLDTFLTRVMEDPELLAVYDAMEKLDSDKPAALSELLGLPVREVDKRKRKLRTLMATLFGEIEGTPGRTLQ